MTDISTCISAGKTLELCFLDGDPEGRIIANIFNWTGCVLMGPRIHIIDLLKRDEAKHTGVYLLIGEKKDGKPLIYIGEGEKVSRRIIKHAKDKDWWTTVVIVTTVDNSLHKAYAKYLESRLLEEARDIGHIKLENGNEPSRPSLIETEFLNMETFLQHIFLILPALRIDCFLRRTRPTAPSEQNSNHIEDDIVFELQQGPITAKAIMFSNGEFVVQSGSMAKESWSSGQYDHHYRKRYDELVYSTVLSGVKENNGKKFRTFTSNYKFSSVSAAAAVVLGRSANGPTEWKIEDTSTTYKEWEAERLPKD